MQTAESTVAALLSDIDVAREGRVDWAVRLITECTYLLGDIATARGDTAGSVRWVEHGLRIAKDAAAEERTILMVSGQRRTYAPVRNRFSSCQAK